MSGKIIFYHNPQSRAVMVHWMLEEVGADYDTRLLSFDKGEHKSPEFLAINPMGKLPTIVVDGTPITETPAIIAWLADAYPESGLAPPLGSLARATWYRWLFFGGSCIEPAMVDQMLHRPAPAQKGAVGWGSYDDVIDALEATLQAQPYLLGDSFTAADLYVGSELNWGGMFGAPRLKESDILQAYVRRVTERPAYERAAAVDAKLSQRHQQS
jgi:glutathione S-transferase